MASIFHDFELGVVVQTKDRHASRGRLGSTARSLAIALCVLGVVGWGTTPHVLTTPSNLVPVAQHFPTALLAEPIQLRAGYAHTTQPFFIKGPHERWTVSLGFIRSDTDVPLQQKLEGASDICWTDSPLEALRQGKCRNVNPGIYLRWELVKEDDQVAAQYSRDSLTERGGGTYSGGTITRTLSGFTNQDAGQYRLRVTVLRDANELDFLKPHIVVDRPFFRHVY